MKRAYRRMWRVVPCTSGAIVMRTKSKKDIGEILKTKLYTIQEQEAELVRLKLQQVAKSKSSRKSKSQNKNKKIFSTIAKKRLFSFKEYSNALLFMAAGLASKGNNFGREPCKIVY